MKSILIAIMLLPLMLQGQTTLEEVAQAKAELNNQEKPVPAQIIADYVKGMSSLAMEFDQTKEQSKMDDIVKYLSLEVLTDPAGFGFTDEVLNTINTHPEQYQVALEKLPKSEQTLLQDNVNRQIDVFIDGNG